MNDTTSDSTEQNETQTDDSESEETDWIVYDNWQVAPEDIDRALRGSEVRITVPGSDQKLVVTTEEVTDDDIFGPDN